MLALTVAVVPTIAAAAQPERDPRGETGSATSELARHAGAWPGPNLDVANTRATTRTPINARNVADLKVKWRLPLPGEGFFGNFSSNPIAVNGTIYLIDLNSRVYAVDQDSGRIRWQRAFESLNIGPNGVAYGDGLLFATTHTGLLALDPRTGETVWARELTPEDQGGVDIAPQYHDHTVYVSTVPSALTQYTPGYMGIVYAFDARTGTQKWEFNTVQDTELWGHPEINSGGGLWFPPAIDDHGRVFLGVGNPAPFPGTPEYPNGASRPGPNLYTNSIVALDGRTGRVLWYQQVAPNDIRDYDFHVSPIVTHSRIDGVRTEIVLGAGKMGAVIAFRADNGDVLWDLSVGRHENDTGPLPDEPIIVFPGIFGGVETPMAVADSRVFVPWVDAGSPMGSSYYNLPDLTAGKGGLLAADVATGRVLWKRDLPQMALGAATVANDVVFTSTYAGELYAFDVRDGRTLWTDQARAGINSFPAIVDDMLLVGASAPTPGIENPVSEFIAYSLR